MVRQFPKLLIGISKSENGAVTVENVLWIPFIFLLSIAMADTFFVYMRHSTANMALEDSTRRLITGALPDCDALEVELNAVVQHTIPSATAHCEMDPIDIERANVSLVLPVADMGIGILAGFIENFTLTAGNQRTREYFEGV